MPRVTPIRPLKLDPTRTGLLRKGMVRAIEERFNKLRRLLKEHLRGMTLNTFCPTGPGGGVDPTCSPKNLSPTQIIKRAGEVGTWLKAQAGKLFKKLEARYGRKTALAIFTSGQVLAWGATAAGAAAGIPVVVPSVAAMLPGAAMAEVAKQVGQTPDYAVPTGNETASHEWAAGVVLETLTDLLVANAPLRLSPEKLTAFNQWLEQMVNEHILERRGGGEVPWTIGWAEQAYRMGIARSYDTVKKPSLRKAQEHAIGKKEFLSITGRVAETKIKILAARAFEDLKGITQAMSAAISRELVSGVLSNASMEDIAQAIDARVEGIGINRARLLARNEVVHAFSEATLDGFEALGVEEVGVSVEWSTTNKPCKLCAPLAKMRLPVAQARGLFPRHPNCLCTPIPAYSKPDLEAAREAIEESVDEETGHSEWAGEDLLDTLPDDSD